MYNQLNAKFFVASCVPRDEAMLADKPFVCMTSKLKQHEYMPQCCNDADFCNGDLEPKLIPIPVTEEGDYSTKIILVLTYTPFSLYND